MLLTNQEIDWMVEILSVWKRYELFGRNIRVVGNKIRAVTGLYERFATRYELFQDYTSGWRVDTSCRRNILQAVIEETRS